MAQNLNKQTTLAINKTDSALHKFRPHFGEYLHLIILNIKPRAEHVNYCNNHHHRCLTNSSREHANLSILHEIEIKFSIFVP